jgi:hypothetical protein
MDGWGILAFLKGTRDAVSFVIIPCRVLYPYSTLLSFTVPASSRSVDNGDMPVDIGIFSTMTGGMAIIAGTADIKQPPRQRHELKSRIGLCHLP